MDQIDRLLEDHARIRAAGDALVAAVSRTSNVPAADLEALRWNLTRESLQHLPQDERYVQVPLETHPDPAVRETARRFRDHANAFSEAFRGHVAQWTADRVEADTRGYAVGVRALVRRLHERLDMEEAELYPLAKGVAPAEVAAMKRNWASDAWRLRASIYGAKPA